MASASSIEAGKAFLKLYVEDNAFRRGLTASAAKLDKFGQSAVRVGTQIGAVGAAITAPFALAVTKFAQLGSQLDDAAKRTGASVEALSELKFAAEQSGVEFSAVEGAYGRMAKTIAAANAGNQSAIDKLTELGLAAADILQLSPDEQFEKIAEAVAGIESPTQRAAAAMGIFGRSGAKLLPMFQDMAKLREEAKRLGLVMSTETAAAAAKLDDALAALKSSFDAVVVQVGSALAPAITSLAGSLTEMTPLLIQFVSENSQLITVAAGAGAAITALGTAVAAFGAICRGTASAVTVLSVAINLLSKLPGPVKIAAAFAALAFAVAEVVGYINDINAGEQDQKSTAEQILETEQRIAELQKDIAESKSRGVDASKAFENMESAALATQMRRLEILQKELEALRQRNALVSIQPTTPAINPNAPKGVQSQPLPVMNAPVPSDIADLWREQFYAGLKKPPVPPESLAQAEQSAAAFQGRYQFGGRGAEQNFGGGNDVPKKTLDEIKGLRRDIRKGGGIKVGNA